MANDQQSAGWIVEVIWPHSAGSSKFQKDTEENANKTKAQLMADFAPLIAKYPASMPQIKVYQAT